MEIRTELKQVLKRLRLSGILFTLMERVSYARGQKLSYEEFLELVLSDEIERRDQGTIERRIRQGSLDPDQTIERFEWDVPITLDRERVRDLFNLSFVGNHENVIICGPVGVGKTYLANAPGSYRREERAQCAHAPGADPFETAAPEQGGQLLRKGACPSHPSVSPCH